MNRNITTLINTSNKVCLEIKIPNRSFENVSQFKCLGRTVTNQNLIKEDIKRRLNSGKVCYLLSSRLLSKNVEIAINKTIILPVVLYGCETSITLRGGTYDLYSEVPEMAV
jgi:hypothetical protein